VNHLKNTRAVNVITLVSPSGKTAGELHKFPLL